MTATARKLFLFIIIFSLLQLSNSFWVCVFLAFLPGIVSDKRFPPIVCLLASICCGFCGQLEKSGQFLAKSKN